LLASSGWRIPLLAVKVPLGCRLAEIGKFGTLAKPSIAWAAGVPA
jgi:hypothetical protein